MFKTRSVLTAAFALLAASLLAACTPNANPSNSNSNTTSSPPATSAPTTEEVELFFVADTPLGFRLYPERHEVVLEGTDLESALGELIGGVAPLDPNYFNLWDARPNALIGLTHNGNDLNVDIDFGGLNVGAAGEMMAVQQLMWTAKGLDDGLDTMTITVNGETIDTLAGHLDASVPFTLLPAHEAIAAVTIDAPLADSKVSNPVVVSGQACTFEANVAWRLLRDNVVVDAGSTIAGEACPVRSPWTVELKNLEPGIYVFRAFELSMKDGKLVAQDTKSFVVE